MGIRRQVACFNVFPMAISDLGVENEA